MQIYYITCKKILAQAESNAVPMRQKFNEASALSTELAGHSFEQIDFSEKNSDSADVNSLLQKSCN